MTYPIVWVLLIAGIIFTLYGFLSSGKKARVVGIVGVFVVVIGLLGSFNAIDFSKFYGSQTFVPQPPPPPSQGFTIAPSPSACSPNAVTSNGKSQADVLIRNAENSSLGYLTGTVSANVGGAFIDTVTTNAGSTASYASMTAVPNCGKGELVATVTTGIGLAPTRVLRDVEKNQIVSGYDFSDKAVHKYELLGASTDVITVQARDTALAKQSNGQINGSQEVVGPISGSGTADGTAYYLNTSLGARGTINFYLDYQVNGTATVAGQYNEPDGVLISYDTATAARFSPNSLTLQVDQPSGWSITKVQCPADIVNNRNTEACWSAPSMKAGVLYRIRGVLTADLGDPLTTDTAPIIYIDDKVSYRDTDGSIKYGFFSTSGTNQGIGGTALRFVLT